jgi:geranylgeranyl diphosphate synthase type I
LPTRNGGTTAAALDWLDEFVRRRAATPEQEGLLGLVVEEGRHQAVALPLGMPPAEIPVAVYGAAGGQDSPPLPLAAGCLCVYLGADVLDNVVDRELSDRWAGHGPNQALLAGVTFLTPLAAACLTELDAPAATRLAIHDALTDALLTMSAGQAADVAFEGRDDVTLDACEAMVVAKSGAEWALLARAGALLAGAPEAVCDAYTTFGRELGAAGQLISDCADLGDGAAGRDLAAGKRTLPIVYALATLPERTRRELLGHLAAAPESETSKEAARQLLRQAGAFHYGALAAEVHRQRALAALRSTAPTGPTADLLYALVEGFAIGRPPTNQESHRPAHEDHG